jgi:putative oxidoreductase
VTIWRHLRSTPHWTDAGGWVLRGGVAVFFIAMGADKFRSGPSGEWVRLFAQIGVGQWFRYFTCVVEIAGALLYAFPLTTMIGAALLGGTMVGAIAVHVFIRHSFAAIMPAAALVAIVAIALREPERPLRMSG